MPGAQQAAIQALATDQGSCGSQGSARIAFHALMCVLCAVSYFRPPRLASHLTGIIHSLLWAISHSKQAWWCKSEVCQQGERPAAHAVVHAGWNQHAAGAGHMRPWYTVACSRQGVAVGRPGGDGRAAAARSRRVLGGWAPRCQCELRTQAQASICMPPNDSDSCGAQDTAGEPTQPNHPTTHHGPALVHDASPPPPLQAATNRQMDTPRCTPTPSVALLTRFGTLQAHSQPSRRGQHQPGQRLRGKRTSPHTR